MGVVSPSKQGKWEIKGFICSLSSPEGFRGSYSADTQQILRPGCVWKLIQREFPSLCCPNPSCRCPKGKPFTSVWFPRHPHLFSRFLFPLQPPGVVSCPLQCPLFCTKLTLHKPSDKIPALWNLLKGRFWGKVKENCAPQSS